MLAGIILLMLQMLGGLGDGDGSGGDGSGGDDTEIHHIGLCVRMISTTESVLNQPSSQVNLFL